MTTRPSHSIVLANSTSCRPRFYGMPSPFQTLKRLCIPRVPSTTKKMSKSVRKSTKSSKRGKLFYTCMIKVWRWPKGSWCHLGSLTPHDFYSLWQCATTGRFQPIVKLLYHQIWIINSKAQWVKLRSTDLQVQSLNTAGTFVLLITIYQYFRSWFLTKKLNFFSLIFKSN